MGEKILVPMSMYADLWNTIHDILDTLPESTGWNRPVPITNPKTGVMEIKWIAPWEFKTDWYRDDDGYPRLRSENPGREGR